MSNADQDDAATADRSRALLNEAGASDLPPRPWQHRGQPLTDLDFVRFAAWASRRPDVGLDVVSSGIRLLESARTELDQIESALLFAARAGGMTWPELSEALGLRSPQAAQQRLARISARLDDGT